MARSPKIRITENDRKEYARLVKNTKTKVKRTIKNVGRFINDIERDEAGNSRLVQIDIEKMLELPSLSSFKTRAEFNVWKEQQQKFTSGKSPHSTFKKNKHGVAVTDYLLTVGQNKEYKAEREARKEMEKRYGKPVVRQGKVVGTQMERVRMMANPDTLGFASTKFNFGSMTGSRDIEKAFDRMDDRSQSMYYTWRKRKMQDNWIESLKGSFNSLADDVIERMERIPADKWYELYKMFPDEMTFEIYDSEGQFVDADHETLDELRHYLDLYESGNINFDLKGF